MSSTLPIESKSAGRSGSSRSPLPFSQRESDFDLVGMLLEQQQSLTAVEQFSEAHSAGEIEPSQSVYYRQLLPATPPQPGQQLAFEVNLDSCSGCKACVVACHTMNGLEETESWRKVGTLTIGATESEQVIEADDVIMPTAIDIETSPVTIAGSGIQHVTTACHHCEDPGCLNGCPVKAYVKEPVTGIVRHLDDQCIGCKYCTMMCPYEVPKYSKRLGIVRKCDMCHQRLKTGEAPACVQSCPNEAIAIRTVERVRSDIDVDERLVPEAPLSTLTRPTTQYVTDRADQIREAVPQDSSIDEVAESHWPLALMLIGTEVSVGMIALERFVALGMWLNGSVMPIEATRLTALVSLVIAMVGLNIAPLHLGQPLRAWRVFLGLRTSWLSREAVLLGKYVGALVLATVLLWLPVIAAWTPASLSERIPQWVVVPSWASGAALAASLLLGAAGLYSSAMIYIATRRELWRFNRTMPRFLSTGLIVGASLTALTVMATTESKTAGNLLLLIGAMAGAAKLFWETGLYLGPAKSSGTRRSSSTKTLDERSRRLVQTHLTGVSRVRLFGGWIGVAACMFAMAGIAVGWNTAALLMMTLATVAFLAGESSERLLYFMSVVYDRMPGTLK
ncbi:Fe-S-cluster-containing dehydrogenase component/DMSO reductase anchor subunit [Rhodopirellula rubra]|uniref:Fe-S-cluster-containing dehydrogenase component/DMSO reductase anchor subunit n=1 Tax=Aporhodopirellula rubra TaxID=980271 RepID=A0A7W5DWN5_9BACT|nr:DmsC/YnfH family molybdoenzyme membrane anchor subunit [Aporhodopirellula rubra]MBB3205920.1 Fe-S-cluster-containing dehydrogenase component/DMSO reductase anchor subunit [Aporhodopirellula rubra]